MFLAAIILQPTQLTADDILKRSQQAYDAFNTFEQDTVGTFGRTKGTARISYTKPDKLRVSGLSMGKTRYDLVCDGKNISILNASNWNQLNNITVAIAAISGISVNAGSLVPSTLMHSPFGGLMTYTGHGWTLKSGKNKLGKPVYKVHGPAATDPSIWIDATTNLIIRAEVAAGAQTLAVTFSTPRINPTIAPWRFRK